MVQTALLFGLWLCCHSRIAQISTFRLFSQGEYASETLLQIHTIPSCGLTSCYSSLAPQTPLRGLLCQSRCDRRVIPRHNSVWMSCTGIQLHTQSLLHENRHGLVATDPTTRTIIRKVLVPKTHGYGAIPALRVPLPICRADLKR